MNAAQAIFNNLVYIGNRTDGSNSCGDFNATGPVAPVLPPTNPDGTCPHVHPGILVVDAANPANPTVVGEFGNEFATGANVGQTSRELRVWPAQKLLMVMYFRCSRIIHACPRSAQHFSIRFFDLAANPLNPPLIATYTPSQLPHEMYLWIDPKDPSRALLWLAPPTRPTTTSTWRCTRWRRRWTGRGPIWLTCAAASASSTPARWRTTRSRLARSNR